MRFSQFVDDRGRLLDRAASVRAVRALGRHNMVYEISIRPWQYSGLLELASASPETTYILGHLGKPRITGECQADWYAGIEKLALLSNVKCKISVALETPDDAPYRTEIMKPLVRHVVRAFGYDRILFGSNFPVNFIAVGCTEWLDMLAEILTDASDDQLERLYFRNARQVYRLPIT